jgi:myo-inositol 2-dehydrogenase / D-chiro-inositol 1-dehydrogenase
MSKMINREIRVGLIGAGRIGKIHAETLARKIDGVILEAIANPHIHAAQALAEKFQIRKVCNNPEDIFNDPQLDAVAICSPSSFHSQHIIAAARAGKHIFCEKPISYDLAEMDRCLDVVKQSGVTLQIGFNRRFDPNMARLKEIIEKGEIGSLEMLNIISREPVPPPLRFIPTSGGMLFDMSIHDFDTAHFLFGEVDEVHSFGGVLVIEEIGRLGDIDTAATNLRFRSGAVGTIQNSRRAAYGYDQRVEVFGSKGMAASGNMLENNVNLYRKNGALSAKPLYFFLERYQRSFELELDAFIQCLRKGEPSPVSGEEARYSVLTSMAAMLSLKEDRPVRIREII